MRLCSYKQYDIMDPLFLIYGRFSYKLGLEYV